MNELLKYATFSIDLLSQVRVNSMFSMGRARIFYLGANPNRSIIEGEVAIQLANSIPGTPITGLYNYETEDFEEHGDGQSAYGFVPLEPNASWVKVNDNGKEKEYLEVDVVIWDGRFEEAKDILVDNKSLSMELDGNTLKGSLIKMGEHMYYKITHAEFSGITVLGNDVRPCFQGAKFLTTYSKMVNEYTNYMLNIRENTEGGISHMDNIEEIIVEEVAVIEETKAIEEVVEEVNEEAVEETIEAEVVEEITKVVEEQTEDVVEEDAPTNETEFAKCGDKTKSSEDEDMEDDKDDKEDEKDCPDCGESPCVCKNAKCGSKKDYSELELEVADYKAKNESLAQELNAALEALNKYTRNEKLEIITKFSTKLENSDELIASLTEKVDDLTKEEIKSELGMALVEQIDAEEPKEDSEDISTNFSLNLDIKQEIGNGAWDLVKRFKDSK